MVFEIRLFRSQKLHWNILINCATNSVINHEQNFIRLSQFYYQKCSHSVFVEFNARLIIRSYFWTLNNSQKAEMLHICLFSSNILTILAILCSSIGKTFKFSIGWKREKSILFEIWEFGLVWKPFASHCQFIEQGFLWRNKEKIEVSLFKNHSNYNTFHIIEYVHGFWVVKQRSQINGGIEHGNNEEN